MCTITTSTVVSLEVDLGQCTLATSTVSDLTLNGTTASVIAVGTPNITKTFEWVAGSVGGSDALIIAPSAYLEVVGRNILTGKIINEGITDFMTVDNTTVDCIEIDGVFENDLGTTNIDTNCTVYGTGLLDGHAGNLTVGQNAIFVVPVVLETNTTVSSNLNNTIKFNGTATLNGTLILYQDNIDFKGTESFSVVSGLNLTGYFNLVIINNTPRNKTSGLNIPFTQQPVGQTGISVVFSKSEEITTSLGAGWIALIVIGCVVVVAIIVIVIVLLVVKRNNVSITKGVKTQKDDDDD